MTYQDDYKLPMEYLEQLSEQGTEYLPELIRILVNAAMQIERQKHLGAVHLNHLENGTAVLPLAKRSFTTVACRGPVPNRPLP